MSIFQLHCLEMIDCFFSLLASLPPKPLWCHQMKRQTSTQSGRTSHVWSVKPLSQLTIKERSGTQSQKRGSEKTVALKSLSGQTRQGRRVHPQGRGRYSPALSHSLGPGHDRLQPPAIALGMIQHLYLGLCSLINRHWISIGLSCLIKLS